MLYRVRSVPVRAHWTLLLVLPYLAAIFAVRFPVVAKMSGARPEDLVLPPLAWGLLVAVGLFASVLFHELAHVAVARRAGGRVREIVLMLLGGVSLIEHMPRRPRLEAMMAAAGPLSSLVLGAVLLLVRGITPAGVADLNMGLFYLGQLNLALGLFNLVPAFPLDGGRVLRALLAGALGAARATRIAAGVGTALAVALGLFAVLNGDLLLLLIALFLVTGAQAEAKAERARELLSQVRVSDVMMTHPPTIRASAPMDSALGLMRTAARLDLVVVRDDDTPLGVLLAADVADFPPETRRLVLVGELGDRLAARAVVVSAQASAQDALDEASRASAPYLLAVDRDPQGRSVLVGFLGRGEVENALALRTLEMRRPTSWGAPISPRRA